MSIKLARFPYDPLSLEDIRPVQSGRFVEYRLDDAVAVYDTFSGETHVISNLAWEVVELLKSGKASFPELIDEFSSLVIGTHDEIATLIDEILSSLREIGIIGTIVLK